jgi:uncharacterized protein
MYKSSKYTNFFFEEGSILLFNFFSRACLKIQDDELETVKEILKEKGTCTGERKSIQDILIKNGFIINSDIDEIDSLEYLYNLNYFRTDEINVVLVPTLQCNCKCPYCFEAGHKNEIHEDKDYFTILKKFADINFRNKKRVHISLFGGEPLLKRDELFSYLDYLTKQSSEYGYELSTNIVTNGVLLDKQTVSRLLQYNCISIQVTLDGNKETHDKLRVLHNNGETFDTIVENFLVAVRYGIQKQLTTHFILRINLLNQNIEDITPIFKLFSDDERRRTNIIFRPIYATHQFDESNSNTIFDLKKFYDASHRSGFGIVKSTYLLQHCESDGGINFFYITPDLKIWKCINNMSTKTANIGTIEKTGNLQLNSNHLVAWYQKTNPFRDEKCRNCDNLPLCYGGCVLHIIKTGKRKCISKDMSILPYFYS